MMSTFLLLLIFVGFSAAQQVTDEPSQNSNENSGLVTWVVVGVVATTTISVLIIMIPSVLYHKFSSKNDPPTPKH